MPIQEGLVSVRITQISVKLGLVPALNPTSLWNPFLRIGMHPIWVIFWYTISRLIEQVWFTKGGPHFQRTNSPISLVPIFCASIIFTRKVKKSALCWVFLSALFWDCMLAYVHQVKYKLLLYIAFTLITSTPASFFSGLAELGFIWCSVIVFL